MTLKELIRSAVTGEMEDVSGCEADAEAFPGGAPAEFFLALAAEKRERLNRLRDILREGTGFRQRNIPASKSVEAALRGRAARATQAASVYSQLSKLINKPENKEALRALAARELETLAAVRKLQESLKK